MARSVLFVVNVLSVRTSACSLRCTSSFLSPLRLFPTSAPLSTSSPPLAPFAQPATSAQRRRARVVVASRRSPPKSSASWSHSLRNAWRNASSNERFAFVIASFAALAFASTLLNVVFHVSLFLAVTAVSLIAAPLLFLVLLSFTAFTVGVLMTTGFGFLIFGAPVFTVGLMTKMLLPLLTFVAGVSFVASRLLPFGRRKQPAESVVIEQQPIQAQFEDEFERFDDALKSRVAGSTAINVECWGLNEVIDELDFSGLGEYRQLFIEQRIDGHTLLSLSDDDIKAEFARFMPLGDRMRLTRLVAKLRRRSLR